MRGSEAMAEKKHPTVELLETTPHFTSINPETGLLETRHAATGDLLAVQKDMNSDILKEKDARAITVMVEGKPILLEAGVSADGIKLGQQSSWIYSQRVADSIAQLISEGWTLKKICETPGFPNYHTIAKWRREHEDFDTAVKQAFQNRGEYHRDRATELLEDSERNLIDPDDTPIYKFQTETHLKLASLDNSERFGQRSKVEANVSVAHFMLDTGIRRPGDPGYFKDQTKIVQELRKEASDGKSDSGQDSAFIGCEVPAARDGGSGDSGKE